MTIKCKAVTLLFVNPETISMLSFFSRKNFLNLGRGILINLITTIIILVLFLNSYILVQSQTLPNADTPEVEKFFDPRYQPFAKCIRERYGQNNNGTTTIRNLPWITGNDQEYGVIYNMIEITQICDLGNLDIESAKRVVSCLDEIDLINNFGWNQTRQQRLKSCFFVTKNTLGPSRQAYIDCIIRAKYNPQTNYLDKNNDNLENLCVEEREKALTFPKNAVHVRHDNYRLPYYSSLLYCLDHNQARPKFQTASWRWESHSQLKILDRPNCRWLIYDFSQLRMKTPSELGIPLFGGGDQISLPDLNFDPIIIDIPTEQTCWISKEDKNAGPNLTNIWNPGNWLPIMYNCQNTTPDGRPIPLHPINFIPIAIRLFAFITSLLIWLIILNLVIGIILFVVGVATSILAWVKKILIGSVAVVIVLIFMYFILYFILSIFQG